MIMGKCEGQIDGVDFHLDLDDLEALRILAGFESVTDSFDLKQVLAKVDDVKRLVVMGAGEEGAKKILHAEKLSVYLNALNAMTGLMPVGAFDVARSVAGNTDNQGQ